MNTELLHWHAVAECLPDDDTSVLICMPSGGETVSTGRHIDGLWYDDAGGCGGVEVSHWAAMPIGVVQQAQDAPA